MAARIRTKHQDEVRARIQAAMLVNRLTKHVQGKVEMTPTQVKAAEILLKKSVPDLQSMQLVGDQDNPIKTVTEIKLIALDAGPDSSTT